MSSGFVRRIVRVGKCGLLVAAGYAAVTALLLASARLAQVLGYPDLASRLPWYLSRAAGMTAYLLLSATTLLGLAVSTRIADRVIARPTVFGLHEYLAWLGLAATGLHLGGLLADTYLSFGVIDVAVPFAAPYRPGAVALGIVGLYLSAVLTGSFYPHRQLLCPRSPRTAHVACDPHNQLCRVRARHRARHSGGDEHLTTLDAMALPAQRWDSPIPHHVPLAARHTGAGGARYRCVISADSTVDGGRTCSSRVAEAVVRGTKRIKGIALLVRLGYRA
jgi:hypothetical protein